MTCKLLIKLFSVIQKDTYRVPIRAECTSLWVSIYLREICLLKHLKALENKLSETLYWKF